MQMLMLKQDSPVDEEEICFSGENYVLDTFDNGNNYLNKMSMVKKQLAQNTRLGVLCFLH